MEKCCKRCKNCEKFDFRYFLELYVGIQIFDKNPLAAFLFGENYVFEEVYEKFENISYIFFHPLNEENINYLFGVAIDNLKNEIIYLENKYKTFQMVINIEYKYKFAWYFDIYLKKE